MRSDKSGMGSHYLSEEESLLLEWEYIFHGIIGHYSEDADTKRQRKV